jgi:hypothetical protein
MDEYDHPEDSSDDASGLTTILTILASALSLFVCLMSFTEVAQIGPDVGEIVSFDPQNGPRYWSQPGIPARDCVLMPSVMARYGGSLVIEAKDLSLPPVFRVHWSGRHTAIGEQDCGRSADITLQLVQLRALANVAGGYGTGHLQGLF